MTSPCDPDTRTPGDRILLFNGFNAAVMGANPDGKFQKRPGHRDPERSDAVEQLEFPLAATSPHIAFFTAYQIAPVDGSSTTAATADAGSAARPSSH